MEKKKMNIPLLVMGFSIFLLLLFFPLMDDYTLQKALALLLLVAFLWISEAIPLSLTALLIPVAAIVLKLVQPQQAFAGFSHPIIFLFMGGFVLAAALSRHALDKLLAKKLIQLAKGNFYKSAVLLMLATSLLSCWVSNTSSTVMMIPLALGMLVLVKKNTVSAESKFLMLGLAYSANIGGILSLVGSPPNAIGAALLDITFMEWMKFGIPIFVMTFPLMVLVLTLYFKPDKALKIGEIILLDGEFSRWKPVSLVFGITIFLWLIDGVVSPMLGISDGFSSMVAVFAIFMVFLTGILTWEEIINSIQWEVLLLFGGGLTLGMVIETSGLGAFLVREMSGFIATLPFIVFLWLVVFFSIMLTEFMSNTASAALILPLLFTMATELHINPMILVLPATIAATYGFMMPVGTPPNTIVFSSGFVPQRDMLSAGLVLNILFSIILTLFCYVIF